MNTLRKSLIIGLAMTVLLLSSCVATPALIPTTPTPEPGIGVPISSNGWQVSLDTVRTADLLKMGGYPSETTFTPNDGYVFLVVDMTIRSLDPTRKMDISVDDIAILDSNNTVHTADGGGWNETSMCAGCFISLSKDVGTSETSTYAVVTNDNGTASLYFSSISDEEPVSFVFVVKSDEINQEWELQFKDISLISFEIGDEAEYPLVTESTPQASPLPQECQVDNFKLAQTKAGLVYQAWADDVFTINLAFPDGSTPVDLCAGFAYGALQIAPDGGLLLKTGPLQGWASLYIVEPDGETMSLVRNALSVSGDFVPGTNYVIVSIVRLGQEGRELYLYDRNIGTMTSLYEGRWINYRIFPNGDLLVDGRLSEDSDWFEHMGPVGTDKLPVLQLPEGTNKNDIIPDGEHLLYTIYEDEVTHLFISNLDGSDQKEIMSGDISYGDRVLSPDGKYLLIQTTGMVDNMEQAALYDITTGSSLSITPDSNNLEYSFSPDGKWVVAISTFNRGENDEAETQDQTLYLFNMDNKEVVKEIQGEIVNYFFSPDNSFLAYTMKNEDESLGISVIKLVDLSVQPIGQGILTGWSADK